MVNGCHANYKQHCSLICADNSGRWGRGGVFSALSSRSTAPEKQYELAFKMKDLHLGDAHMVPVDDRESREQGRDYVSGVTVCVPLDCQCWREMLLS